MREERSDGVYHNSGRVVRTEQDECELYSQANDSLLCFPWMIVF